MVYSSPIYFQLRNPGSRGKIAVLLQAGLQLIRVEIAEHRVIHLDDGDERLAAQVHRARPGEREKRLARF